MDLARRRVLESSPPPGRTNAEIGEQLVLSVRTVEAHRVSDRRLL
jgi:FixJ family two-component response regulator